MTTKNITLPTPAERAAALKERRQLKMARSAHAYVRGNTKNFYDWLEGSTGQAVPAGPPIWICGDCHAGNIGPIASAKGTVAIQIRDLDQTVIGNPAHDLIRLGLSMASAARGSDLPGVTTARMMEQLIEGYEQSFGAAADVDASTSETPSTSTTTFKASTFAKGGGGGRHARSPERRIARSGGGGNGAPMKHTWSRRALPNTPGMEDRKNEF